MKTHNIYILLCLWLIAVCKLHAQDSNPMFVGAGTGNYNSANLNVNLIIGGALVYGNDNTGANTETKLGFPYQVLYNGAAPFITTWRTTTTNESITIPTYDVPYLNYHYSVDWGDGTTTYNHTTAASHIYNTSGDYTVTIRGEFPSIYFNDAGDKDKIIQINQWGDQVWHSMLRAFKGCINLNGPIADTPKTGLVISMNQMFEYATSFNQPLNNWNVSNVRRMEAMFKGASAFNQPLNNWDVSSAVNMRNMFEGATSFNQPLNNWDVSSAATMRRMFKDATSFNQPLNNWDVSNVQYMGAMFSGASAFNQSLNNWDVSNVMTMNSMFEGATSFNQPLNNWDVSNVEYMEDMFSGASAFNQPINNWNIGDVDDLSNMFKNATSFNQPLNNWNVSSVTFATSMFEGASSFNQPLNNWDFNSIYDMNYMFKNAIAFNQPLDNWDVSYAYNMTGMFQGATSFNQPLDNWDVSNVSYMDQMFTGAASFNQPLNNWNVSEVDYMTGMFQGAASFNQPLDNWDVSNVNYMSQMFTSATSFNQPLNSWDVSDVFSMSYMFYNATAFDQPLNNWNVSSVSSMSYMFDNASLSVVNYDATLIGWLANGVSNNVTFSGGNSHYCTSETARNTLINTHGWTITDAGIDCSTLSNESSLLLETTSIYPNPFTNEIFVELTQNASNTRIYLYTIHGQLILEQDYIANKAIKLDTLASGTYLLKIVSDEAQIVKQIIKK